MERSAQKNIYTYARAVSNAVPTRSRSLVQCDSFHNLLKLGFFFNTICIPKLSVPITHENMRKAQMPRRYFGGASVLSF
jgi:hypothetical protein